MFGSAASSLSYNEFKCKLRSIREKRRLTPSAHKVHYKPHQPIKSDSIRESSRRSITKIAKAFYFYFYYSCFFLAEQAHTSVLIVVGELWPVRVSQSLTRHLPSGSDSSPSLSAKDRPNPSLLAESPSRSAPGLTPTNSSKPL